jgi:hypothetical protein
MKNLYLRLLLTCVGIFCLSLASFADNSILPPKLSIQPDSICIEPSLKVISLDTGENLTFLTSGDTFLAGDYLVHVLDVTNSISPTGIFSGKGYVEFEIFKTKIAKLSVKFDNITINECYEMTNGFCETEYDPKANGIIDLDDLGKEFLQTFNTLREEVMDLIALYGDKPSPEGKIAIDKKIQELNQFKQKLANWQEQPELANAIIQQTNELSLYVTCQTSASTSARVATCTYNPWIPVAQCLGAAVFDVFITYTFKYLELKLDNTPKAFTDFQGITSKLIWADVTNSALLSCAFAVIPLPAGKGTALVIAGGTTAASAEAFANNILTQWNQLSPQSNSMRETYDKLQWSSATLAATQAGLTTAITMGITALAKHPSVKSFTEKVALKARQKGPAYVKEALETITGITEKEVDDILAKLGIKGIPGFFNTTAQFKNYLTSNNLKYNYLPFVGRRIGLDSRFDDIRKKFKVNTIFYDCFGFPSFLPFVLDKLDGVAISCMVEIDMTGTYDGAGNDYDKANEALAKKAEIAKLAFQSESHDGIKWSWHHHQDGKHMMLIPALINSGGVAPHSGGAWTVKNIGKQKFDDPKLQHSKINNPCN